MTPNENLKSRRPESWESKYSRWKLNFFPCYLGTGAKVIYLAKNFQEAIVQIPLNWRTRNVVGTIFGGSLYGAIDPIYMLMLMRSLGSGYIVWDKAAAIQFKKPARSELLAHFQLTNEEIDSIKNRLKESRSIERVYTVNIADQKGIIHATAEKTLYIRRLTQPEKGNRRPAS
ncbi:MAG: YiiD C-terminal domain-containing protein [Elusimicrobia bacterium]|nr:YiiD C-terminal domain-containing protein [Elusimicrobiota bacterium]